MNCHSSRFDKIRIAKKQLSFRIRKQNKNILSYYIVNYFHRISSDFNFILYTQRYNLSKNYDIRKKGNIFFY